MGVSIGIDVGSRTVEVLVHDGRKSIFQEREATSFDYLEQVRRILSGLDTGPMLVTGYGRHLVAHELGIEHVTEIKAHAAGIHHLFPGVRTILDIGGQDTKAILLDDVGRVARFEMNDRCAAGTGRFLEVMAQALGCTVGDIPRLAARAEAGVTLSSMCTVFVETEVVTLMARGARPADVAKALVQMVARRSASMLRRVGLSGELAFCGGVARNSALVAELGDMLGMEVRVPREPDFTGALGAAILAVQAPLGAPSA